MKYLTFDNYAKEINESKSPVVIDFYADWCPPCRMLSPVIEALDAEYKQKVKFMKLDVDKEDMVSSQFGVQSIPTIVIMKNGLEIGRFVGFLSKESLKSKIDETLKKT